MLIIDEKSTFATRLQFLVNTMTNGVVSAFARKCEIGESTIRKYLSDTTPGILTAVEIADKCGVDLLWLCSGRGDPFKGGRLELNQERAAYLVAMEEFVLISHYDVQASAGLGAENGHEEITHKNAFRRDWWHRYVGVSPSNCFTLDVVGDSMAPRLTEGHVPIVQRIEGNEMLAEAIYVFRLDGEVFIKHLERVPGRGLIAKSENPNYTPWEIGDGKQYGEFKIIGRVIRKQLIELP